MPERQRRAPRLKDSCDRCSVAKVRCNKDKPSCERCQQKGLSCCYSFSRRAGRRTTTSNSVDLGSDSSMDDIPSLTSSPENSSDIASEKGELFDAWSFPTSHPQQPLPQSTHPDVFEDELFRMANGTFGEAFPFPQPLLPLAEPSPIDPLPAASFTSNPISIGATPPEPPAPPTTAVPAPMHRSSSTASSIASSLASNPAFTSIHDELSNLSDFAATMERKFDAVVRTRMQFRDVYSEFGVPLEEFEGDAAGGAGVKTPDLSELGMYYCLAELRRRLKWLGEDVGNLMGMDAIDEDEMIA